MDSAEFLDLLGNANRRRILRLLSQKPCYVTEISEYLGVSPKAVIDHLRQLEEAGLVESRTDDRRRKYFSIAQHVRLEVTVSPYEFGTRSAYPTNSRFDVTTCRRVNIDLEALARGSEHTGDSGDERDSGESETAGGHARSPAVHNGDIVAGEPATLARRLRDFEQLERELSLAQRWTDGRITELRERLAEQVEVGDPRLVSEVLVALAEEPREMETLCRRLGVPAAVVEELLDVLAAEGVVVREGRRWHLTD